MKEKQRGLAGRDSANNNNNYSNNRNVEFSKILIITLSVIAVILAITFSAIIIIKALNSNKETGDKTEQKMNVINQEEPNEMPKDKPTVVDVAIGDTITLGTYEQDNNMSNGKEPIEWRVLEVKDEKALLISEYGIDCKPYNEYKEAETWETCTLREWLNDEFYEIAFSDEEKRIISEEKISADENPYHDSDPGNDTWDYVFALSIAEAEKYFDSDEERECKPTVYAISKGVYESTLEGYEGNCWWWLRSPGIDGIYATGVDRMGTIGDYGFDIDDIKFAVRPAIWIKL